MLPMSTPKKPRTSVHGSTAQRTNVLLEKIASEFRAFGEGQTALQKEFGSFNIALLEVGRDVEWMKPVVKTLAPVPDELRSQSDILRKVTTDLEGLRYSSAVANREIEAVKTELRLVRSDLTTFSKRLEAVEAKSL